MDVSALPLQGGRILWDIVTQGGGEYALPWAKMLRPYRAKTGQTVAIPAFAGTTTLKLTN